MGGGEDETQGERNKQFSVKSLTAAAQAPTSDALKAFVLRQNTFVPDFKDPQLLLLAGSFK